MALILHIETSAKNCSVALSQDGKLLFDKVDTAGSSHSVQLGLFVDEALKMVEARSQKLDGVAVSSGPGSYTGLRIGVSMAKGICYALGIPLIAVPTLDLLADEVRRTKNLPADGYICPLVDARRMEVYTALYDADGTKLHPVTAVIVDAATFETELESHPIWFVGDGAEKCSAIICSENANFDGQIVPLAKSMLPLAERLFQEQAFEDVAYFEPFYLKDFVATVSKKPLIPVAPVQK
ncbi:MAG TPA: tRNA (adenosine(37)-N6)-threonylcarbamoyltransferase complex dimerization subunit type 1 TsaB [Bacteroidales bacterium]|nr:tRNA (adenosine(37)-N6)-threonylcarbamoyltransferase complex dimerization subunit type 1 TsaB [Bacteroidales bacterium]